MAVATPVLERQTLQIQKQAELTADELHNAQIKENYKRLINPELSINEVRGRVVAPEKQPEPPVQPSSFEARRASILQQPARQEQPVRRFVSAPAAQPVRQAQPYLVTNARADAEIFRADSAVNRRFAAVPEMTAAPADEDENEDLRPTSTTIQYKTVVDSGKNAVKSAAHEEAPLLGKREKIIIATFISVVVALFILVIVNSAVIAGLNSELALMEQDVTAATQTLGEVDSLIDDATGAENIAEFAQSHGMVLD